MGIAAVARFGRRSAVSVLHTNMYFVVVRRNPCRRVALCVTQTRLSNKQGTAFFVFCYCICVMLTEMLFHTNVHFDFVVRRKPCRRVTLCVKQRRLSNKQGTAFFFCFLLLCLCHVDWDVVENVVFTYCVMLTEMLFHTNVYFDVVVRRNPCCHVALCHRNTLIK